jgi:polyhydroxyalkanoate synthesis regulator phasin
MNQHVLTALDNISVLMDVQEAHRKAMQAEIDRLKERVRELEEKNG